MERIRIEWVNMWVIIGEHFNQVCTRLPNSDPTNPMSLGLLPQQHSRLQFCPRRSATAGYALLGEGRAAELQVPERLPQAIRARYDPQCQSRGPGHGPTMPPTDDPSSCSQFTIRLEDYVWCICSCVQVSERLVLPQPSLQLSIEPCL
jgi:hypothetical protein